MTARAWLEQLARLSPADLKRISRLVDELVVADRPAADVAGMMLDAPPAPSTQAEARARLEAVIAWLERERAAVAPRRRVATDDIKHAAASI